MWSQTEGFSFYQHIRRLYIKTFYILEHSMYLYNTSSHFAIGLIYCHVRILFTSFWALRIMQGELSTNNPSMTLGRPLFGKKKDYPNYSLHKYY